MNFTVFWSSDWSSKNLFNFVLECFWHDTSSVGQFLFSSYEKFQAVLVLPCFEYEINHFLKKKAPLWKILERQYFKTARYLDNRDSYIVIGHCFMPFWWLKLESILFKSNEYPIYSSMMNIINLFIHIYKYMKVKVTHSCPSLWNPMVYRVHGILQARILEWVVFPFSRGSSQPRDQTQASHVAGGFFISWTTREAQGY